MAFQFRYNRFQVLFCILQVSYSISKYICFRMQFYVCGKPKTASWVDRIEKMQLNCYLQKRFVVTILLAFYDTFYVDFFPWGVTYVQKCFWVVSWRLVWNENLLLQVCFECGREVFYVPSLNRLYVYTLHW